MGERIRDVVDRLLEKAKELISAPLPPAPVPISVPIETSRGRRR
jgi:hypothetical protein